MKVCSLFSGIGGFDLAFKNNNHEIVYANDFDKNAVKIYEKNFGKGTIDSRNIKAVKASDIPEHDILCAGFPCQAFSIAGKRQGFNDTRGTLFFEIVRILGEKNPRYFLLENVKGLLSHANGQTFRIIISALAKLGYDLQWCVLNSKNFGVPQNRERVFIIGNIREKPRPKVFLQFKEQEKITGICHEKKIIDVMGSESQMGRIYSSSGLAPSLHLKTGGWQEVKIIDDTYSYGMRKYDKCPSLRSTRNGLKIFLKGNVRKLTPVECERLQSFPDNWTEGVSETARYNLLGNAVTVNVIDYILKNFGCDMDE